MSSSGVRGVNAEPGSRKVLVVDNDAETRELVGAIIESQGIEVAYAESGEQAKQILIIDRGNIHVVVTDVRMGALSGLDLCRWLNEVSPEIPVVIMSGTASRSEAEEHGAVGFFEKPVDIDAFIACVSDLLGDGARTLPKLH